MRKKYLWTAALFVAALTSCSQDEQLSLTNEDKSVFTGSMEVIGSRTELEDTKVVWKGDETITIFEMDNVNAQYKVSGAVENGIATFEFVNFIKPDQVIPLGSNYAVYPYDEANTIDADGNISAPVSAEYTFTDRASSIETALMVAKTDNKHFNFTNAQGIIRLRLNAQQPYKWGAIQSITLTSKANLLSGTAKMTWGEGNEAPIAVIQEGGGKELTINLSDDNKKELPASQDKEYAEFYVPVVPTLFAADDLTLTIEFANSKKYEVTIDKTFEVERKEIQSLKHTIGASTWEGEIEGDLDQDNIGEYASVSNVDELLKWAYTANNINNSYGLKLMNDIEMPAFEIEEDAENQTYKLNKQKPITVTDGIPSGSNWIPIRSGIRSLSEAYSGHIEGNNKKISGLYMKYDQEYVGLIGYAYDDVSVKNLTIENSVINSSKGYVGAIMGESQHNSLVENAHVKNTKISGKGSVGGIVGHNYSRNVKADGTYVGEIISIIRNCTIDKESSINGTGSEVGGICGSNYGAALIYCVNNADVTGNTNVGGVVGMNRAYNTGREGYVIACSSTEDATIHATGQYAGGIVGNAFKDNKQENTVGHIVACYSLSTVTGKNNATLAGFSTNGTIRSSWAWKNGVSSYAHYSNGGKFERINSDHFDTTDEIKEEFVNAMNQSIAEYNNIEGIEITCPYTWSWTSGSWPVLK